MVSVVPVVGFLVAPVVSAAVYVDASRRDLSPATRSLLVAVVGTASFGGFLLPYYFADPLRRAYLQGIKPNPVVTSPYEMLAMDLTVGTTITVLAVLSYGLGSRYGMFANE